jgi:hypothetical protein
MASVISDFGGTETERLIQCERGSKFAWPLQRNWLRREVKALEGAGGFRRLNPESFRRRPRKLLAR